MPRYASFARIAAVKPSAPVASTSVARMRMMRFAGTSTSFPSLDLSEPHAGSIAS